MGWQVVVSNSKDMAVHAALLPTGTRGRILYFGGYLVNDTHLFDCDYKVLQDEAQIIIDIAAELSPPYNAFCGGHAFLADGRLLVAGGQLRLFAPNGMEIDPPPSADPPHPHGGMGWGGERRCSIFYPKQGSQGTWHEVAPMNLDPANNADSGGRWYPTLVTLENGEVLAVGGHPDRREHYPTATSSRHSNNVPERFNPGGSWLLLGSDPPAENQTTASSGVAAYDYQRTHLLPNGRVFFASPVRGKNRVYDPSAGEFLDDPVIDLPPDTMYQQVSAAWTSVMLPLLHQEFFRPRVLLMGGTTAQRIDVGTGSTPAWTQAGSRKWTGTPPIRHFCCPVILPTGKIFFSGGCEVDSDPDPDNPPSLDEIRQASCVTRAEIYTPPINWQTGQFGQENDTSWETQSESEAAEVPRHYHSTALLLPNGAVWTAGSNGPSPISGGNELRIETYEPSYFQSGRPVIDHCPANIGYVYPFVVKTNQANSIQRVALIRCGSVTHAFNPDQRYISVDFEKVNSTTLRVFSPPDAGVAPPGYYMLWIVDTQGRPCEWASFIRISYQKSLVAADISTYSVQEVQALGLPAQFNEALYLMYEGFLPDEVGQPTTAIRWADDSIVQGMQVKVGPPKFEGGQQNKDTAQRVVFACHITFTSDQAFEQIPAQNDFEEVTFRAEMGDFFCETKLRLSLNPNPRMRDGDVPYLSIDLRAFTTSPGAVRTAGVTHGSGINAPYEYIQEVLDTYDSWPANQPHPFDELPLDLHGDDLPLYPVDANGKSLFNYAIARVRYIAPEDIDPISFRVFFRLWTTGWTAISYDAGENGSYRRHGNGLNARPLLGLTGGEINTIPCFAQPREANMELQQDDANLVAELKGKGPEQVFKYVGCWLDFNQTVKRFPLKPVGNGPFSGDLLSIQSLMRGPHQCLVAEIHFEPDPISFGATPGSSDDLAQRNLILDETDNPGGFGSHLVHHTFEIKPSPFALPMQRASTAATAAIGRLHPDEICIDWGNLPRDSHVTFYLPQVDADDVIRYAALRQGPLNLARTDAHTIHCKVTDVGFIPIPGPFKTNLPGLMTVQLPPNLTKGQTFKLVVRQVDGRKYRVIGTFEFRVLVGSALEILPRLKRRLSVLKHIALSIPAENRWYPVFERYLGQLGDRLRALGADPDAIAPSPTGSGQPDGEVSPSDQLKFEGKVCQVFYDCFGDFEGFVLEDCDRSHTFRCRDRGMERLARIACRDRSRLTVYVKAGNPTRPCRIVLSCCC